MTNLDRSDRRCEEESGYNWRTCLDHLFYTYKGCQDPWYTNPGLELPVCTNLTYILGHTHNRPPAHISYDGEFADRPYKAEQELTKLRRNDVECWPPCRQTQFYTDITYRPRERWVVCGGHVTLRDSSLLKIEQFSILLCSLTLSMPCLSGRGKRP